MRPSASAPSRRRARARSSARGRWQWPSCSASRSACRQPGVEARRGVGRRCRARAPARRRSRSRSPSTSVSRVGVGLQQRRSRRRRARGRRAPADRGRDAVLVEEQPQRAPAALLLPRRDRRARARAADARHLAQARARVAVDDSPARRGRGARAATRAPRGPTCLTAPRQRQQRVRRSTGSAAATPLDRELAAVARVLAPRAAGRRRVSPSCTWASGPVSVTSSPSSVDAASTAKSPSGAASARATTRARSSRLGSRGRASSGLSAAGRRLASACDIACASVDTSVVDRRRHPDRDRHAVRRRRRRRRGGVRRPAAPPGRPRLGRLRRLRHDRRGGDADRRRAPARSSSWPSRERPAGLHDHRRHRLQRHPPRRPPDRARDRRSASTRCCRVTPYYNRPNRRGIVAHYGEVARATDKPVVLYNIPLAHGARHAQRPAGRAGADRAASTASSRPTTTNLAPIDGLEPLRRQRRHPRRARSTSAARRHPRRQPPRRRRDAPHGRRARPPRTRSTPSLRDIYAALVRDHQPDPASRRRSSCSGHLRSAACACRSSRPTSDERAPIRAVLERHGLLEAAAPLSGHGKLRVLPLGGLGEIGKNMTVVEYDGRIVVVDVGLRFPTAEMVGIDLVLPGLHATCASAWTTSRASSSPTATRTTSARCRGSCASCGERHPRLRRPADDGDGALQARRAPAARTPSVSDVEPGEHARARPVRRRAAST